MNEQSNTPVQKVTVAFIVATITTLLVAVFNYYVPTYAMPAAISGGLISLSSLLAGYFTPPAKSEVVVKDMDGAMKSGVIKPE